MREWRLTELSDPDIKHKAVWVLDGELKLRLTYENAQGSGPVYLMARVITNEDQARVSYKDPVFQEYVLGWINGSAGSFHDPFWIGRSSEELEEFCRDSSLPLPKEYRDLLEKAKP